MTTQPTNGKAERTARLRWVPIAKMKVSPVAQRELNQSRVDHLAANFDLEQIGTPTVSDRDGWFYVVDGQHRIAALVDMGWGDQQIQCWTYTGLTEEQEAERFLTLNDVLAVHAYSKFKVAVQAGREMETDIDRIVRAQTLIVSQDSQDTSISAVGTLVRVYKRGGPAVLARTLRIVRDAYGKPGLIAPCIDGIAMLCDRYNGALDDVLAVTRLNAKRGGVTTLLHNAEVIRRQTGHPRNVCVAAAAVEIVNAGKGGKKLPGWWKEAA
jgi:hypothetical protein